MNIIVFIYLQNKLLIINIYLYKYILGINKGIL